jgi:hypothetical protein
VADIVFVIFVGLPENFQDKDYTPPSEVPCIIDHLCKKHDGIPVEAKGIKEYSWKIHIKKLFDTGVSVFVLKLDFYAYIYIYIYNTHPHKQTRL